MSINQKGGPLSGLTTIAGAAPPSGLRNEDAGVELIKAMPPLALQLDALEKDMEAVETSLASTHQRLHGALPEQPEPVPQAEGVFASMTRVRASVDRVLLLSQSLGQAI